MKLSQEADENRIIEPPPRGGMHYNVQPPEARHRQVDGTTDLVLIIDVARDEGDRLGIFSGKRLTPFDLNVRDHDLSPLVHVHFDDTACDA